MIRKMKPSRSSGPRNFDEKRLGKPPQRPKSGKGKATVKLVEVLDENVPIDRHGYKVLIVNPDFAPLNGHQSPKKRDYLHNPEANLAIWFSQNSKHSVIVHQDVYYALMGVKAKRERVQDPNRLYPIDKIVQKTLHLLEVTFEDDQIEWIDEKIAEALIPGVVK